jgi:hypothetical protein
LEKKLEDLKTKRVLNGSTMANQMPEISDIKAYLRGPERDPTIKPSNPLQYGRDLEDFKTY